MIGGILYWPRFEPVGGPEAADAIMDRGSAYINVKPSLPVAFETTLRRDTSDNKNSDIPLDIGYHVYKRKVHIHILNEMDIGFLLFSFLSFFFFLPFCHHNKTSIARGIKWNFHKTYTSDQKYSNSFFLIARTFIESKSFALSQTK